MLLRIIDQTENSGYLGRVDGGCQKKLRPMFEFFYKRNIFINYQYIFQFSVLKYSILMVFQFLDLHQRLQLTLQKSYSVPGLAPNSFPEDISPFLCTVSLSWKRKTACFQLLRWLLPGTCGCSVCTILLLHPESPSGTYPGPAVHDKQDTDLYTGTTASHLWFLHLDCSHKWTYDETEAQRAYVFCQECKLISSEDKIQMKDSGTGLRWQNRRTGAQLLS